MKEKSLEIIRKLQNSGHQAYWVGGCVRDILLGKDPKDFDIVTSAKPEEIENILSDTNIIPVGKQFGVLIAEIGGHNFEIATFRSESKYTDARRPDKVFWSSAQKDSERRDFTINALYLDPLVKENIELWNLSGIRQMKSTKYGLVIDYVGGLKDLNDKIIRFIGKADDRINEDHLRILRAVRFKNTLGFEYNSETKKALSDNAEKIIDVSAERIRDELNKILVNRNRTKALTDLNDFSILKYVLPEIDRLKGVPQPDEFHLEGDVFIHTLDAVKSLNDDTSITLIWSVLLHDTGKPETISMPKSKEDRIRFNKHAKFSAGIASEICRRLRFPNIERELIVWLVKNHMVVGDIPKMSIAKQRKWLMDPRFPWLLDLNRADALASKPKNLSLYNKNLELYNNVKELLVEEQKKPKFNLLVTGNDIIQNFGLEPGPKIGEILKIVEEAQLENKISNKDEALALVKKNL